MGLEHSSFNSSDNYNNSNYTGPNMGNFWANATNNVFVSDNSDGNRWIVILPAIPSVFGIIANILVLLGITHQSNRINNHLLLIANLCISDILVAATFLTITVFLVVFVKLLVLFHCVIALLNRLYLAVQLSSILTIGAMAIDHYAAIVTPLEYHVTVTRRAVTRCIITIWVLSLISGVTRILVSLFLTVNDGDVINGSTICYNSYISDMVHFRYEMYMYLAIILATIVLMLYVYIHVLMAIRTSTEFMSGENRTNQRAIVTTILVMATFTICWLPYVLERIEVIQYNNFTINHILSYVCQALPSVNTICDPIIYAIRLPHIVKGIRKAFGCQ